MSFSTDWLPYATPVDPTEDPPASIDPLGLTTPAEYLANLLVPGFTVRTWRARMITFDAVAAHVAAGVVKRMNNRDDVRVEARLIFERLYVWAVALAEKKNIVGIEDARRTLPGIGLARAALIRNEPLSKNNFLKGQVVNGPVGVTTRLAKNMDVLTVDMRAGRTALDLLQKWAADEQLDGVLDVDSPKTSNGNRWINEVILTVVDNLQKKKWPRDGDQLWEKLMDHLRLDKIGSSEKLYLKILLDRDAERKCFFELLLKPNVLSVYQTTPGDRAQREQSVLRDGVHRSLRNNTGDENVSVVIETIENYEHASALLTQGFEAMLWGLKFKGRSTPAELLSIPQVSNRLKETIPHLQQAASKLQDSLKKINQQLGSTAADDPLNILHDDLLKCSENAAVFLDAILSRHERVQKAKHKGVWIERLQALTLMPGFGVDGDDPPKRIGMFLHPFRVTNSYSFLADLGLVKLKAFDEE